MSETKATEKPEPRSFWVTRRGLTLLVGVVALTTAALTALLTNIFERKVEQRNPYIRVVEVGEDDTDPARWGLNWPLQYDGYRRTAIPTQTRFGGHAGSEALPEEKIDRDRWLQRMFLGYAFSIDYRDRRGHAHMLEDQEATKRLDKPQSGSCLHCHASVMPLYRELGDGDAMAGFEASYKYDYKELNARLHESGHAHPVSCVDCHDPKTMALRVTRPGFLRGIAAFAASDAPAPAFSSIELWRESKRQKAYDPNADGTRNEMRSFVCGQCHVEYYCSTKMPLTFPWGKGLSVDNIEAFWDEQKFPDGQAFYDFKHEETGASVLKAQHPEFELWSQGIHARSGVSCADCHMPYMREGATKVSDHWVRSPLLNVNRACQSCHRTSEKEILARVDVIQERSHVLLERGGVAIVDLIDTIVAAKNGGASAEDLDRARALQKKAQWRLDFVAAENSMGFHAPQETARILAEAIDYARQGQLALPRKDR
ncbi:MAG: ammonia-forming cytochrome c nitrite reductase subunit c552 [Polyangiaceae bacterium]|nr:ammonia-forming cytochrome c nitrite reductase subunit c552 [Polyangiaceae bacterium]